MKYYRRYTGDYIRDTTHLNMAEDGAYNRLLDLFYTTEKLLPKDRKRLFAQVRARTKWEKAAVEKVLKEFWISTRWGYRNERAVIELKKASDITAARVSAAKSRTKPRAFAEQMLSKCSQEPYKEREEESSLTNTSSQEVKEIKGTAQKKRAVFVGLLPPPVPIALWSEFVEMRKKIRRPLTAHACDLIVRRLQRLEMAGENLVAVVEQSVRN